VIISLLRFIYLTSPICAGIELKTLSKEEKQRRSAKVNSPWRVGDDQRRVRGEQETESLETTRTQHATASRKRVHSEWRVKTSFKGEQVPESTKNYTPSGEQLAMASAFTREAS
jgi:hypothetical protein